MRTNVADQPKNQRVIRRLQSHCPAQRADAFEPIPATDRCGPEARAEKPTLASRGNESLVSLSLDATVCQICCPTYRGRAISGKRKNCRSALFFRFEKLVDQGRLLDGPLLLQSLAQRTK